MAKPSQVSKALAILDSQIAELDRKADALRNAREALQEAAGHVSGAPVSKPRKKRQPTLQAAPDVAKDVA